jgi:hypothetical protein
LQEFIFNTPEAFFAEIGLKLFILRKEVPPSDDVQDRIDLLCLDQEGNAAVVELKRGHHKHQLLQAIAYAAMVAKWRPEDFRTELDDARYELLTDEFLEGIDFEDINRRQRIILIAESFDYSVLVSAEWLSEQYGVDILCCQVSLVADEQTASEYLVCSSIFPNPKITQRAAPRGRLGKQPSAVKWADWEAALANIQNPAVVEFYRAELAAKRESYLRNRGLRYRVNGKRVLFVSARKKHAYCWQNGRFENDEAFWRSGLSNPISVDLIKDGECMRFHLETKSDFDFLLSAVQTKLSTVTWLTTLDDEDEPH